MHIMVLTNSAKTDLDVYLFSLLPSKFNYARFTSSSHFLTSADSFEFLGSYI